MLCPRNDTDQINEDIFNIINEEFKVYVKADSIYIKDKQKGIFHWNFNSYLIYSCLVRFQVFMVASMKMIIFGGVALCSLVEVYQHFRGACCLHH
jgi:hypothetical protein